MPGREGKGVLFDCPLQSGLPPHGMPGQLHSPSSSPFLLCITPHLHDYLIILEREAPSLLPIRLLIISPSPFYYGYFLSSLTWVLSPSLHDDHLNNHSHRLLLSFDPSSPPPSSFRFLPPDASKHADILWESWFSLVTFSLSSFDHFFFRYARSLLIYCPWLGWLKKVPDSAKEKQQEDDSTKEKEEKKRSNIPSLILPLASSSTWRMMTAASAYPGSEEGEANDVTSVSDCVHITECAKKKGNEKKENQNGPPGRSSLSLFFSFPFILHPFNYFNQQADSIREEKNIFSSSAYKEIREEDFSWTIPLLRIGNCFYEFDELGVIDSLN